MSRTRWLFSGVNFATNLPHPFQAFPFGTSDTIIGGVGNLELEDINYIYYVVKKYSIAFSIPKPGGTQVVNDSFASLGIYSSGTQITEPDDEVRIPEFTDVGAVNVLRQSPWIFTVDYTLTMIWNPNYDAATHLYHQGVPLQISLSNDEINSWTVLTCLPSDSDSSFTGTFCGKALSFKKLFPEDADVTGEVIIAPAEYWPYRDETISQDVWNTTTGVLINAPSPTANIPAS